MIIVEIKQNYDEITESVVFYRSRKLRKASSFRIARRDFRRVVRVPFDHDGPLVLAMHVKQVSETCFATG